jgi:hypothetical protein
LFETGLNKREIIQEIITYFAISHQRKAEMTDMLTKRLTEHKRGNDELKAQKIRIDGGTESIKQFFLQCTA